MDYQPSSDDLYKDINHHLPGGHAWCLNVGCGSGRDSHWLAKKGHKVVAVDRELPECLTDKVIGYRDTLPYLSRLNMLKTRLKLPKFEFILCACVWMYLSEKDRLKSGYSLARLLSPTGRLIIVTKDTHLASLHLPLIDFYMNRDLSGRDITWLTYVYATERPGS